MKPAEDHLRAVFNLGFDALIIAKAVWDTGDQPVDFHILDANTLACNTAGMEYREIIGKSLTKAFPEHMVPGLHSECCAVMAGGAPVERTLAIAGQTSSGQSEQQWVAIRVAKVSEGIVAIGLQDVTRKELERRQAAEMELRYRLLFQNSGTVQLLLDAVTGRIEAVNNAAEAFYGWSGEVMRSMTLSDLDPAADEKLASVSEQLREGLGARLIADHRVASGERLSVELVLGATGSRESPIIHVQVQDLTERRRDQRILQETEARFLRVIESMQEGVLLYDRDGIIRFSNRGAERILGVSAEAVRNVDPNTLTFQGVHADGSAMSSQSFLGIQALRTGKSQPARLMGVPKSDGRIVWLSVTADPLFYPGSDRPAGAVAVFTDVTAIRHADMKARQAEKLEALGQMAGGIAHDLNNLLTVVMGEAELLKDSLASDAESIEGVSAIERSATRAGELVQHLLAVGRKLMLQPTELALDKLIADNLADLCRRLPPSISVQLVPSEGPVTATLDAKRLLDALGVLISNAHDAMPHGGTLTLRTNSVMRVHPHDSEDRPPAPYAVVSVQDTGVGMDPATRARLFEPFFSSQPFGTGRGMGLAAVHGIVHQHHGFIECDSQLGLGTTLRLYFPQRLNGNAASNSDGV